MRFSGYTILTKLALSRGFSFQVVCLIFLYDNTLLARCEPTHCERPPSKIIVDFPLPEKVRKIRQNLIGGTFPLLVLSLRTTGILVFGTSLCRDAVYR